MWGCGHPLRGSCWAAAGGVAEGAQHGGRVGYCIRKWERSLRKTGHWPGTGPGLLGLARSGWPEGGAGGSGHRGSGWLAEGKWRALRHRPWWGPELDGVPHVPSGHLPGALPQPLTWARSGAAGEGLWEGGGSDQGGHRAGVILRSSAPPARLAAAPEAERPPGCGRGALRAGLREKVAAGVQSRGGRGRGTVALPPKGTPPARAVGGDLGVEQASPGVAGGWWSLPLLAGGGDGAPAGLSLPSGSSGVSSGDEQVGGAGGRRGDGAWRQV